MSNATPRPTTGKASSKQVKLRVHKASGHWCPCVAAREMSHGRELDPFSCPLAFPCEEGRASRGSSTSMKRSSIFGAP